MRSTLSSRTFGVTIPLSGIVCYIILIGQVTQQVQSLDSKIDCHPIGGASKEKCESLGCVWSPVQHKSQVELNSSSYGEKLPFSDDTRQLYEKYQLLGPECQSNVEEPWCYFPNSYTGYKLIERKENRVILERIGKSALPKDVNRVLIELKDFGTMFRVRIGDAEKERFEPELPKLNFDYFKGENQFKFEVDQNNSLIIYRKSTGAILFKTDLTKLIFADQFIQLNSRLNSQFVYGLGEHYDTFLKLANSYKTYSFFNYDRLPMPGGRRSYGGFPFYINLDSDDQKHAHGVFLLNSNAMDIVLQPDQSITFRPIGGMLDFFIFSGPTPSDVIVQYQHLVGLPNLPPRWSLGFHLCRYNYNSLEKTRLVWKRNRDAGIPFDVQWNDIDYMERHNDFTYDGDKYAGLPEFVDELHKSDMHYVLLFDPGLSQENNFRPYSLGVEMDIFVKNATNQTLVGKVWNDSGRTVFPDFSNNKSIEYWTTLFVEFQKTIKYDGAWIDMNDISNFVDGSLNGCPSENELEQPPYKPGGFNLQAHSLCLSAQHRAGKEYNLHNLYSFYEAISTFHALNAARPGKRPLIISRSTFPGQGHYGGHWSGDVAATWDYLKWSIPSLIEHSMYGFSLMGSDICGFTGNTTVELCARWSTLGAFYTFSRNHNDDVSIDQDPVALGPEVVEANRNALTMRYQLLPYLYTLIHRAHKYGEPVVRSVPFEFFSTDKEVLKVEYQFMWGRALMISPVVDQNTYTKRTYLPKGRWYESNVLPKPKNSFKVPKLIDSKGEWVVTNNINITDIPLFMRGGHIVPAYSKNAQTTTKIVNQPFSLIVALCPMNMAEGELIVDDGDNIDGKYNHLKMSFRDNKLTVKQEVDSYKPTISFGLVKILGVSTPVSEVLVDGSSVIFKRKDHVIYIDLEQTQVSNSKDLVVKLS